MKKRFLLALALSYFAASSALAQTTTLQPIDYSLHASTPVPKVERHTMASAFIEHFFVVEDRQPLTFDVDEGEQLSVGPYTMQFGLPGSAAGDPRRGRKKLVMGFQWSIHY